VVEDNPGTRRELRPRRVGALPIQPDKEVLPDQLHRGQPTSSSPGPTPVALFDRPIAAFNDAITPSRSTNSLIAAIPAFGVSLGSGARTSTR
jgi:hypothetical protein